MAGEAPTVLHHEHRQLLRQLRHAAWMPGPTGALAARLRVLLAAHLEREETAVLPLLRLLRSLADAAALWPAEADALTAEFARVFPRLLADHAQLTGATAELQEAAAWDGCLELLELAAAVERHVRLDVEVVYPAVRFLVQAAQGVASPLTARAR